MTVTARIRGVVAVAVVAVLGGVLAVAGASSASAATVDHAGAAGAFRAGALASTGSNPTPALIGAGILVAMGVVFLVARAVRGRRDRHLDDD
jgi:LPXTG-motif cell wall-anchored protein